MGSVHSLKVLQIRCACRKSTSIPRRDLVTVENAIGDDLQTMLLELALDA